MKYANRPTSNLQDYKLAASAVASLMRSLLKLQQLGFASGELCMMGWFDGTESRKP